MEETAELIAFEIINTRYNIKSAITVISSEKLIDEIIDGRVRKMLMCL